jgi:tryptophan-rich sensory protein
MTASISHSHVRRRTEHRIHWAPLIGFVAIALGSGTIVGRLTGPGEWYDSIDKSPLNPPGPVFGIVWSVLYVLMGVAAYLVWEQPGRVPAIAAWAVQLALNLAWTPIFFGLERPGWALAEIVVLLAAVVITIVMFRSRSRLAAALLLPYAAWIGFATYLTIHIVVVN